MKNKYGYDKFSNDLWDISRIEIMCNVTEIESNAAKDPMDFTYGANIK